MHYRNPTRPTSIRCGCLLVIASFAFLIGCSTTSVEGEPVAESSATQPEDTSPVVVVLDGSESMQTADAPGPRIDAARAAVTTFVDGLPDGTPFGLVTYGNTMSAKSTPQAQGCEDVSTVVALAPVDTPAARDAVAGVQALGWTPLSKAITEGVGLLGSGPGSVVLVSDGEANCQPDPCLTARSLRAQHPQITISAIGFKSGALQLECVAREGGGVFVTADNAAQLSSRIDGARRADAAAQQLTNTGLGGINLGQTYDDIARGTTQFPALSSGTRDGRRVIIRWAECDWIFDNSTLVEIRPQAPTVSTVDGVVVGTPMTRVVELFGKPVQNDAATSTAYFEADAAKGIALKVSYTGGLENGTVSSIVLCTCLPPRAQTTTSTTSRPTVDGPCGSVEISGQRGDITVFGGLSCRDGETLMRQGRAGMLAEESRVVQVSYIGSSWICGASGASEPLRCRDEANSNRRVEWMWT